MEITEYLTNCVENNVPVSFSKYGDGEYNCVYGYYGRNCDNDLWTEKLKIGLIQSFIYMTNEAENAYIGLWHDHNNKQLWENYVNKPVKWVNYHTIIFCQDHDEEKAKLYKSIKYSNRKKIIICNPLLIKSKLLLNADYIITIPFHSWFDNDFEKILEIIKQLIGPDGNHIILTMCGMSAKVLICELTKIYPKGIYLDIGSGLDILCTKHDSRGFSHSYEYLINLLKDIIPNDWEDDKYLPIYEEAKTKLGIHLPR